MLNVILLERRPLPPLNDPFSASLLVNAVKTQNIRLSLPSEKGMFGFSGWERRGSKDGNSAFSSECRMK